MDHFLRDVDVSEYRAALLDAAARVDVIEPAELREPIALWLRALEEKANREDWKSLLARNVVAGWNAAQAILTADYEAQVGGPATSTPLT
jgi:hypothetical protein